MTNFWLRNVFWQGSTCCSPVAGCSWNSSWGRSFLCAPSRHELQPPGTPAGAGHPGAPGWGGPWQTSSPAAPGRHSCSHSGVKQIFLNQQFHHYISCQPNFKPYTTLSLPKTEFHRKGKESSVSIYCYFKQFSHTAFILTVILIWPAGLGSKTTFHFQLSKCCLLNSKSCIGADVKSTGILISTPNNTWYVLG